MRDAEIPEVRHEPAGLAKAETRPQLEPVGRAQFAH